MYYLCTAVFGYSADHANQRAREYAAGWSETPFSGPARETPSMLHIDPVSISLNIAVLSLLAAVNVSRFPFASARKAAAALPSRSLKTTIVSVPTVNASDVRLFSSAERANAVAASPDEMPKTRVSGGSLRSG